MARNTTLTVLDNSFHLGHADTWTPGVGQTPAKWITVEYEAVSPSIVRKADRVMALMVPGNHIKEIENNANEKEAYAFGYGHRD